MLHIWRQRDLTLKGKILILKSLAASKLIYVCSMIFVPEWFTTAVDKLFTEFLWDGKPAKIKKKTIIANIESGGLKMPHIGSLVKALKLTL
jgi:hypothetical protein